MAEIKKLHLFTFNSNVEFHGNTNDLFVSSNVEINPIFPPNHPDYLLLVIYYTVEPYMPPDHVKFNVKLILPFEIKEFDDLNINDIYYCVEKTREMLQSIFDKMFEDLGLTVPPIAFEDIKDNLISHLKYIKG